MGGLYTLSLALIGERFRGADLTQANTAFVMTFQLGTIVGPPYAGAFMQARGRAQLSAGAGAAADSSGRAMAAGARMVQRPRLGDP